MTATQLIETLSASGVRLSASDGKLKVDAPADVLTAELKTELAAHKAELLALLAPKPCKYCNAPMLCVEAGYFACGCGYQIVEPRSGFWERSSK